jgi:broad specificity phosphatase PhoE
LVGAGSTTFALVARLVVLRFLASTLMPLPATTSAKITIKNLNVLIISTIEID